MASRLSCCAHGPRRYRSILVSRSLTRSSSQAPSLLEQLQTSLHAELTLRPAITTNDFVLDVPSHLLNITLTEFLPPECQPDYFSAATPSTLQNPHRPRFNSHYLPQGHHLVHFAPRVTESHLLADGTDTLHSPGAPFVRRMWAGGSLIFHPQAKFQVAFSGKVPAMCLEDITGVKVKGTEGKEKVFVEVRRRIRGLSKRFDGRIEGESKPIEECWDTLDLSKGPDGGIGMFALTETRSLVFMREKSREEAKEDIEKQSRFVKPVHIPDYSISLTPTPQLLFRWSALTFNAHRIHLDPRYCQEVEGHRNMLVHGPLTLVLMLSALKSQLEKNNIVMRFDYRNLAPLYVNEEMKICVKKDLKHDVGKENKFDVWIEGKEGGYAVKGTAITGPLVFPQEIFKAHTKSSVEDKIREDGQ